METTTLPAREKREAEIRLFKKQAHGMKTDEESLQLHTEERHPEFLKLKGDAFFKQGNYKFNKSCEAPN